MITRVVTRLKKLVPGIGGGIVKHTRKVKKIYLGLMKVMKGRIGKDETTFKKARDKLVKITRKVIADAQVIQAEIELLQEKLPLAKGLLRQMGEWIEVAEKVVWQTKEVMAGNLHLPPRVVSFFDVDARPIRRGKSRAVTEFGRKVEGSGHHRGFYPKENEE